MDEKEKLRFYKALVWHPTPSSPSVLATTRASARISQRNHKSLTEYNTPARLGTKAC